MYLRRKSNVVSVVQRRNDIAFNVLFEGDFFKGCVGSIEVIVDNDVVARAGLSCIRDLGECSGKTPLDGFLAVGATSAQSATEGGHVGRGDEEVDGVQIRLLDLPDALEGGVSGAVRRCWETYLRLDIEHAPPARFADGMDGLPRSAVKIRRELGVFDKGVIGEEGLEGFCGDKVILFAVRFSRAGLPGGV